MSWNDSKDLKYPRLPRFPKVLLHVCVGEGGVIIVVIPCKHTLCYEVEKRWVRHCHRFMCLCLLDREKREGRSK